MILRFNDFINEGFINYNYDTDKSKVIDLINDDKYHDIIFSEPTDDNIKKLNKILKDNKNSLIRLYHGTSPKHDILKQGILTTKAKTKRSMQSEVGYVYLSIYPDTAKTFGNFGYAITDASVYEVLVPIKDIKPDKDQLKNKRMFGEMEVGDTLADSILYGSGVRVKGDIPPYMITKI